MNTEPHHIRLLSNEEASALEQFRSLSPAVQATILSLIEMHAESVGGRGNVVFLTQRKQ